MNKDFLKPEISEYQFFRLLLATMVNENYPTTIKKFELEDKLYKFHKKAEFSFLFEDLAMHNKLECRSVDLNSVFIISHAAGFISLMEDLSNDMNYAITMDNETAELILKKSNEKHKTAVSHLLNSLNLKEKNKIKVKKI